MKKILVVGEGSYPIYERAFYNELAKNDDYEVKAFFYGEYYNCQDGLRKIIERIEEKFVIGIGVININCILKHMIKSFDPDLVFIYSGRLIAPWVCRYIRDRGICLMLYCNDDPFSDKYPWYYWRSYRQSIKYANITYVYRANNVETAYEKGAKKVKLLRSYYISNRNFFIEGAKDKSKPRIGFIGHYENDGRLEYILTLLNSGIDVTLTKTWKKYLDNCVISGTGKAVYVEGTMEDYNRNINELMIAIVFLSKLNNDMYTRRCFEIPATRTMMLSEFSDDLSSMYEDGKEIVFFRNKHEFVDKAKYYLEKPELAMEIGDNGYNRLKKDGHEASDRVMTILEDFATHNGCSSM